LIKKIAYCQYLKTVGFPAIRIHIKTKIYKSTTRRKGEKKKKGGKEGKKERKEGEKRKEEEGGENPKTYTRDPACDEELSRAEREKIPRAAGSC
jgi:hypothetical protein